MLPVFDFSANEVYSMRTIVVKKINLSTLKNT